MKGEASCCPDIRGFAEGIRRDEGAVHAAVRESWSNGPVEGHLNRLKMINRLMFGRARFSCYGRGCSAMPDAEEWR